MTCPCGKRRPLRERHHDYERESQTKLICPPKVEEFRQLYIRLLREHGLKPEVGFFFGGCIRDFLLGGKIVDFDLITHIPIEKIKRIFDQHKIYYEENVDKRDHHIYVPCGDDLLQIGFSNEIPPDYTINGLRANIVTLEITLCEQCRKDIHDGWLRLVNDDPRVPRRGIYMCYKYPFLKFTPETIKELRKIEVVESNTLAFIKRKNIEPKIFYEIARKWGLDQFNFLRKHL